MDQVQWLTNRYFAETYRWAGAGIPMAQWPPLLIQLADDCHTVLLHEDVRLSRTMVLQALQQIGQGAIPSLEKIREDHYAH